MNRGTFLSRRDWLATTTTGVSMATGLPAANGGSEANAPPTANRYDVAAYYWPAYHDEPRIRDFFDGTEGEWTLIRNAKAKFEGHNQPRVPLWGFENESDPRVMGKKIRAAAAHGVNVLVFDWYWYEGQPFLEKTLNEGFLKAPDNGQVRFFLMWANHDCTTLWDIRRSHKKELVWPGSVDRANFEIIVNRIIRQYFKHPSYYRIDGEPVFSIYDLSNLLKGLGGLQATKEALAYFRAQVRAAGFPGLHLQAILWAAIPSGGELSGFGGGKTQNDIVTYLGIDSLTNYQWVHIAAPAPKGDYVAWAEAGTAPWERWTREFNVPYYPHVSIGWDSNPRVIALRERLTINPSPDAFAAYLWKAKRYVDQHRKTKLITVNSWNEWTEGGYLEPDTRWGFRYLEAVRTVMGGEWNFE